MELENYIKQKNIELPKEIILRKKIKEKLSQYFEFEVPDYIIDDIAENEEYNHLCLMINIAIYNNRILKENGKALKEQLEKIFNINNRFEKIQNNILF